MRYLAVLLCAVVGAGCQGVRHGNACISPGYFAGDVTTRVEDGRKGTVIAVYGRSSRCQDPKMPNLAQVKYE